MDHGVSGAKFGRVEEYHEQVVICGQGPSWSDVQLEDVREARAAGAAVIAVNGAIEQLGQTASHFFTLDFSSENHHRLRHPLPGVRYYVAAPEDYPERWAVYDHVTYLRRIVKEEPQDGRPFSQRVVYQIVGDLADEPDRIHTGNSGFGALGLARHMRPRKIVLLGMDGTGRERWDGTPNGYLGHCPDLFDTAEPDLQNDGIEVVNGSPRTAIETWTVSDPRIALRWLFC